MQVEKVLNYQFEETEIAYSTRDVMLYALGLGLGHDNLRYVYERNLKVLPSFAMVVGHPGSWIAAPELEVDYVRLLHAEQHMELFAPVMSQDRLLARFRVLGIVDKGAEKGAIVYVEKELSKPGSSTIVARVISGLFCRSNGGTGNRGSAPPSPPPLPARIPDQSVVRRVDERAALIYRLSGDYNPLHVDPDVSEEAGYDQPILHGLCTMGIAGHVLLEEVADGDPARFGGYACRFTRPVFPGETLRTDIWTEPTGARYAVTAEERDQCVLDRGVFTLSTP
ncbi:MAG: MaoC/PaaZ C-terminal domain-containing protein [Paracoccaceae bacterium]